MQTYQWKYLEKNNFLFLLVLFHLLLLGCTSKSDHQPAKSVLPNTPESVSKQWQFYLDNNEIEKVATLSTERTKAWLEENKVIFLSDNQSYKTNFVQMECSVSKDTAICNFTILEEGELIDDYFILKKENGQWLVDLDEENGAPDAEEQFFKEMEKELKLSF